MKAAWEGPFAGGAVCGPKEKAAGLLGPAPEGSLEVAWEGPFDAGGRFEPGQKQRRLCLVLLRYVCASETEVVSEVFLHLQHVAVMQKQVQVNTT